VDWSEPRSHAGSGLAIAPSTPPGTRCATGPSPRLSEHALPGSGVRRKAPEMSLPTNLLAAVWAGLAARVLAGSGRAAVPAANSRFPRPPPHRRQRKRPRPDQGRCEEGAPGLQERRRSTRRPR
jgi:hypothetical protein